MSGETRIGPGIAIEGEIEGEDDIRLSGRVQGSIRTRGRIQIEKSGNVRGDLAGSTVEVKGRVEGDVISRGRVEVHADAAVAGTIRAARILIADGARFTGSVDMEMTADAGRRTAR